MNTNEIKLYNLYSAMRDRLVNRVASLFNGVGGNADDAVNAAFEYVAPFLLGRKEDFTEKDLENMICNKVNLLFKDARASSTRDHGRRSVKTVAVLDDDPGEGEDYRVSIVDKYSYGCYRLTARDGDDVDRSVLQSLAIRKTMKQNGASDRDVDIVDRFLWSAPDRKALAAEFKTSVTNVNRIKCVWLQRLPALAPQIKTCYAELLKQAA